MNVTSSEAIVERLVAARGEGPAALAFDADGTLWSGDVGEDTFEGACRAGVLKEEGRAALARTAEEHGVSPEGSATQIAETLYAAYHRGTVPERVMCEVMTFCYAGYTEDALRELARGYLTARGLAGRTRQALVQVLAWARGEGLRCIVISASPRIIVNEGLRLSGIEVDEVGAAVAKVSTAGVIEPGMAAPLPYGPQKCVVGASLLTGFDWLGAFGDNGFDVDMLRTARVAVAVHPKPALLSRLSEIPNVLVLSDQQSAS
jgi:phosphatidylglycerophosphatase C